MSIRPLPEVAWSRLTALPEHWQGLTLVYFPAELEPFSVTEP